MEEASFVLEKQDTILGLELVKSTLSMICESQIVTRHRIAAILDHIREVLVSFDE
jgi:hypothetical protein